MVTIQNNEWLNSIIQSTPRGTNPFFNEYITNSGPIGPIHWETPKPKKPIYKPIPLIDKDFLYYLFGECKQQKEDTNRTIELYLRLLDTLYKSLYESHFSIIKNETFVQCKRNRFLNKLNIKNDNPILNKFDHILTKLHELYTRDEEDSPDYSLIWISGGSVVDLVNGSENISGDIDVWVKNYYHFNDIVGKLRDADSVSPSYAEYKGLFGLEDNIQIIKCDAVEGQCNFTLKQSINAGSIGKYDFRLCSIAYDGTSFVWKLGALGDVNKKRIILQSEKASRNAGLRLQKYIQRGYSISNIDYLLNSLNMLKSLVDTREVFNRFIIDPKFNYSEEAQTLNSYED